MCFVLTSLPLNLRQVAEETSADPSCQRLIKAIESGWHRSYKQSLTQFYQHRQQLALKECKGLSLITRGSRVFVPESLRTTIL